MERLHYCYLRYATKSCASNRHVLVISIFSRVSTGRRRRVCTDRYLNKAQAWTTRAYLLQESITYTQDFRSTIRICLFEHSIRRTSYRRHPWQALKPPSAFLIYQGASCLGIPIQSMVSGNVKRDNISYTIRAWE
jgi:hypothetical protein